MSHFEHLLVWSNGITIITFAAQTASFTSKLLCTGRSQLIFIFKWLLFNFNTNTRLYGFENALIKMDPDANADETISNNVLLDVINSKRTNIIVSSYTVTYHMGEPMHIYCGEDHIFMKSQYVEHRIKLNGVQQLQSDYNMTWVWISKCVSFIWLNKSTSWNNFLRP